MKRKTVSRSRPAAGRGGARGKASPTDALYRAVLSLASVEECRRFFADLCTPAELEALGDRWAVAQLVDEGVPYREIHDRIGVSTATVTRVGRALTLGEGGYRIALDRLAKKQGARKK